MTENFNLLKSFIDVYVNLYFYMQIIYILYSAYIFDIY